MEVIFVTTILMVGMRPFHFIGNHSEKERLNPFSIRQT